VLQAKKYQVTEGCLKDGLMLAWMKTLGLNRWWVLLPFFAVF
jgi:hypothetical protein